MASTATHSHTNTGRAGSSHELAPRDTLGYASVAPRPVASESGSRTVVLNAAIIVRPKTAGSPAVFVVGSRFASVIALTFLLVHTAPPFGLFVAGPRTVASAVYEAAIFAPITIRIVSPWILITVRHMRLLSNVCDAPGQGATVI
jgi:hypothetical protein